MGLFDRITKKKPVAAATGERQNAKKPLEVLKEPQVAVPVLRGHSTHLLVSPRVSEKAAKLASKGTYVFQVALSANKVEIRKAIEALYKVNVTSVRTVRGIGKFVSRGRVRGQRVNWKKAVVSLKPGQKIDLYEGV